jgi:hypothetical protein
MWTYDVVTVVLPFFIAHAKAEVNDLALLHIVNGGNSVGSASIVRPARRNKQIMKHCHFHFLFFITKITKC